MVSKGGGQGDDAEHFEPAEKPKSSENSINDKASEHFRGDLSQKDQTNLNDRVREERDPKNRLDRKTAGRGNFGECSIDSVKACGKNKDTMVTVRNGLPEKVDTKNQSWERDANNSQKWHVTEGNESYDLKADVRLQGNNLFATVKYENGNEITFKNGQAKEIKSPDGETWTAAKNGSWDVSAAGKESYQVKDIEVSTRDGTITSKSNESGQANTLSSAFDERSGMAESAGEQGAVIFDGSSARGAADDSKKYEMIAHETAQVLQSRAESPESDLSPLPRPTPHKVELPPVPIPKPIPPEHIEAHLPAPHPVPPPTLESSIAKAPAPADIGKAGADHIPLPVPHKIEAPNMEDLNKKIMESLKTEQERVAAANSHAEVMLPKIAVSNLSIPPLPIMDRPPVAAPLPVLKPAVLASGSKEGSPLPLPLPHHNLESINLSPAPVPIRFGSGDHVVPPLASLTRHPEIQQTPMPLPVPIESKMSTGPQPVPIESHYSSNSDAKAPSPIRATTHSDISPLNISPVIPVVNEVMPQEHPKPAQGSKEMSRANESSTNLGSNTDQVQPAQNAPAKHINQNGFLTGGTSQTEQRHQAAVPEYQSAYSNPQLFGNASDNNPAPLQGGAERQHMRQGTGVQHGSHDARMEANHFLVGGGSLDAENYFNVRPGQLSAGVDNGHRVVIEILNRSGQHTGTAYAHVEGPSGGTNRELVIDNPTEWKGHRYKLNKT